MWRPGPDGAQVALVHRPKYDDWSFPKGKTESGEHVLLTATREVAEEAAVRVVLGRRLKSSEYEVDGRPKVVSYWAAKCVESSGFVPGHEVDDLAWIELPDVAERLSYDRDRLLIHEFATGPLTTVPLVLLRHAQAGTRSQHAATADAGEVPDAGEVADAGRAAAAGPAGPAAPAGPDVPAGPAVPADPGTSVAPAAPGGPGAPTDSAAPAGAAGAATADLGRPLDEQGAEDARTLAELLITFGPCRVITSAAERCVATVRPYAEVSGMPVEIEPDFTAVWEDQGGDRAAGGPAGLAGGGAGLASDGDAYLAAAIRTADLVAQRQPTLICAHRENLPVILDAALTELGAGEDFAVDPLLTDPPLGKGSFVVLQSADGILISAERHDLFDLGGGAYVVRIDSCNAGRTAGRR